MIHDMPNAKELNVTNPTIEFKNVWFKQSEDTTNNFNIQSGGNLYKDTDNKQVGLTTNGTAIVTPKIETEHQNAIEIGEAKSNT